MNSYVHTSIAPAIIASPTQGLGICNDEEISTSEADGAIDAETKEAFLKNYGLLKLTMATVARWMHAVGFRHTTRGKHYFVDGHEKPETLEYCKVYTKHYLDYELRAHCWIQLPLAEATELEKTGHVLLSLGYSYTSTNGVQMLEFHVDSSRAFETFIDNS